MSDEKVSGTERPHEELRRAWTTPYLRELGSVAALTRKVAKSGRNDGGAGTLKRS